MSVIADLFDRITSRRRERELSAHDQLASAAKRHVRGEQVDPASIEEALFSTGQSVADFRKLCDIEEKRHDCFRKIEGGAASKTKLEKLEQMIEAEGRKFLEIRSAHESRVGKLDEERRQVAQIVEAAATAKDWLLDLRNVAGALGVEYREALEAHEHAEGEVSRLRLRVKQLRNAVTSAEDEAEAIRSQWDRVITDGNAGFPVVRKRGDSHSKPLPRDVAEKLEQIDQEKAKSARRLAEAEAELGNAERSLGPTEGRLAAIRKKLLTP
jgi:predicted nuclease with TOPRIM domain